MKMEMKDTGYFNEILQYLCGKKKQFNLDDLLRVRFITELVNHTEKARERFCESNTESEDISNKEFKKFISLGHIRTYNGTVDLKEFMEDIFNCIEDECDSNKLVTRWESSSKRDRDNFRDLVKAFLGEEGTELLKVEGQNRFVFTFASMKGFNVLLNGFASTDSKMFRKGNFSEVSRRYIDLGYEMFNGLLESSRIVLIKCKKKNKKDASYKKSDNEISYKNKLRRCVKDICDLQDVLKNNIDEMQEMLLHYIYENSEESYLVKAEVNRKLTDEILIDRYMKVVRESKERLNKNIAELQKTLSFYQGVIAKEENDLKAIRLQEILEKEIERCNTNINHQCKDLLGIEYMTLVEVVEEKEEEIKEDS